MLRRDVTGFTHGLFSNDFCCPWKLPCHPAIPNTRILAWSQSKRIKYLWLKAEV